MSALTIIRTKPGEKEFSLFGQLPSLLYPSGSQRFALPDTLNTEFLQACYVLLHDSTPCARLALYMNPHLSYHSMPAACVGNYECTGDALKAAFLLHHAFAEAKKNGAGYIIGPMNGSTWDNYRFSEQQEPALFFPESYHHLYYSSQFLSAGFEKIGSYFSAVDTEMNYDEPSVIQRSRELKEAGVTIRNIDLPHYRAELERLYPFITGAFKTNFLYTPITKETFMNKYLESEKLIDPQFVLVAEDAQKEIVGVFFCLNDLFSKKEKRLVIKTIARHPDKKWSGLGHVMANEVYKRAVGAGYSATIHAFMYDAGTSTGISKNFSGKAFRNYSLYGKKL